MTDTDLVDRVAELEQHAERLILAGDPRDQNGWGAWHNLLETRLHQQQNFLTDVVSHALARFHRQILDEVKAMLDAALGTRVKGTYQAGVSYTRGDMVALDGGSFIARKDNPGPCPGGGWQLMAKQGARGRDGPEGKRGPAGNIITGWIVDRSCYRITPRLSDGTLGPPLELRELFEPTENTP
jgi:hypothetical protein